MIVTMSRELPTKAARAGAPTHGSDLYCCEHLAGDLGFEPRLTAPEAVVLPLHQSPMIRARPEPHRTRAYQLRTFRGFFSR